MRTKVCAGGVGGVGGVGGEFKRIFPLAPFSRGVVGTTWIGWRSQKSALVVMLVPIPRVSTGRHTKDVALLITRDGARLCQAAHIPQQAQGWRLVRTARGL